MGGLRDFAGGKGLRFFQVTPDYVDPKQKPGFSKLKAPSVWDWVGNAIMLKHIWASPNLIWGSIALAFYFAFPYDLSKDGIAAQAPLSLAFFKLRFPLWFAVTFGYNLFWHVTLYWAEWAKRPFIPGRTYNWDKVFHNIFWSTSGIAIWTLFDNVFAFLWASGRLPYMSDAEAFSSWTGIAKFVAGFMLVPLWREGHFYFAHRLLHFKPLYAMVHSLHHRNQDIEPFAGLSMDIIEHLYYYACIMPSLLPYLSPFHFLWNGMHLLLSPGASHSGWEDHMQSDAFHYMHHRHFECNYAGFGAAALDVAFGTFMESLAVQNDKDKPLSQPADAKSTLREPPTFEFILYHVLAIGTLVPWAYAACNGLPALLALLPPALAVLKPYITALSLSLLAGFGPVLAALPWYGKAGGTGFEPKYSPGFHWTVGSAVCSMPIVIMTYLCF